MKSIEGRRRRDDAYGVPVLDAWRILVNAHVDGDFDQRGLPYPLVLTFYFSIDGNRIVQLIILRNQPD